MNTPAPTELLKLAELAVSNGEVAAQLGIKDATLREALIINFAQTLRRQAASVGAEVAGEAVAWRIHPDDTLFLCGETVTDEKGVAEIWERSGNRIEPLGVLASPSRSEGVSKGEVQSEDTTIPGSENMDARFAWLQAKAIDMGYMLVPEPDHPDSPHAAAQASLWSVIELADKLRNAQIRYLADRTQENGAAVGSAAEAYDDARYALPSADLGSAAK